MTTEQKSVFDASDAELDKLVLELQSKVSKLRSNLQERKKLIGASWKGTPVVVLPWKRDSANIQVLGMDDVVRAIGYFLQSKEQLSAAYAFLEADTFLEGMDVDKSQLETIDETLYNLRKRYYGLSISKEESRLVQMESDLRDLESEAVRKRRKLQELVDRLG